MRKVLFTVVALFAVATLSTAQVTLKFNPQKGSKYQYNQEMIQKINQDVMGQKMVTDQVMRFMYEMDVKESNANSTKMDFVFREVAYSVSNPMMSMKYDSKAPQANPNATDAMMGKIFGSIIGKKFEIVIAPDGSVTSVSGMDEIVNGMIEAVASEGQMAQQMAQGLRQQLSNESMKATMEQVFKQYPSKPVKAGDTWNINVTNGAMGMNMKMNNTYTLKSANAQTAVVGVESTVDGMNGQITGTQTGTIEYDTKTGIPKTSELKQDMKGKVSAQGMEIPMDIDSTIKITTTKLN